MSKKDNLLKFWESLGLESHQQSKDIIKPCRTFSQSMKILPSQANTNAFSQSDLLSKRRSTVTSRTQLSSRIGEKKACVSTTEIKDDNGEEAVQTSVEKLEDGLLPFLSRNDLLTHTTKNRVKRIRRPPTKQKTILQQVAGVERLTTVDEMMPSNCNQTPPAASVEFSSYKYSPTSTSFLDTSSPTSAFDAVSPKPAIFLAKASSTFTTFVGKPLKSPKIQPLNIVNRESSPVVPLGSRILSSPKPSTSPLHNKDIGSLLNVGGSVVRSNLTDSDPRGAENQKCQTSEQNSNPVVSSKYLLTPSKAVVAQRRASLQAVTTPYKAFQAVIIPIKAAPVKLHATNISSFVSTVDSQASSNLITSSSISTAVNLLASHSKEGKAVNTPAVTVDVQASLVEKMNTRRRDDKTELVNEGMKSGLVTSGTELLDVSDLQMINLREEFDKKVRSLENDLAEEKVARVKLEKEVEALKLVVNKLSLET